MFEHGEFRQKRWLRFLACVLIVLVVCASFVGSVKADAAGAPPPGEPSGFWMQLLHSIVTFDSKALFDTLRQKEFQIAAIVAINIIVFVETGLLIGFFLPGDSLLVTAGIVCAEANWPLAVLIGTVCVAAIVGDSIGYSIGYKTGPKIFNREKSFFFHKDHLLAAQKFYEAHGGKTIILARFMPIIRTFAPVVAGVGRMEYRRFLFYNIFGGIGWVVSMIMIGFYLTTVFDPPLKQMFGDAFTLHHHIEKVIIVVVLISVAPGGIFWLKKKLGKRPSEPTAATEVAKVS